MPQTVSSTIGSTGAANPTGLSGAYCSGSEFIALFDLRTVADLLGDNGKRYGVTPPSTDPDPTLVVAHPTLLSILMEASGMVEMACTKGERYMPIDLFNIWNTINLTPSIDTNTRHTLIGIVAGIGMWLLYNRRPNPNIQLSSRADFAIKMLDRIALGELVFGTLESQDAGLPKAEYLTEADQEVMNLATFRAERLFGRRNSRDRLAP